MEREQRSWHEQMETLLERVKQCETESPLLNGQSVAKIEGKALYATGELLTAALLLVSLYDLRMRAALSNSDSPVTREVMSYAYWAMETRIMSMCGQLKALMMRFVDCVTTTKKVGRILKAVSEIEQCVKDMRSELDTPER